MSSTSFVFAACNPGSEAALKREVARTAPDLRPSYGRPGFVTFKTPAPVDGRVALDAVLARAFGACFGARPTVADVAATAAALDGPLHLHVWERDATPDAETPAGARAAVLEEALREALGERARPPAPPRPGDAVLDVVCAADAAEPPWVGWHVHDARHLPQAGGWIDVAVPDDAPSRAYRKLEEMIAAFALPVRAGQTAVELGAAPGGAAYALLRRGLSVVGVDPGDMAPQVLAQPGFRHLPVKMGAVDLATLPDPVHWLVLDVHLAPPVALRGLSRFLPRVRRHLAGAILTLKLNTWSMIDDAPRWLDQVRALGFANVRAAQLPSHRQEIGVAALAEKAALDAQWKLV